MKREKSKEKNSISVAISFLSPGERMHLFEIVELFPAVCIRLSRQQPFDATVSSSSSFFFLWRKYALESSACACRCTSHGRRLKMLILRMNDKRTSWIKNNFSLVFSWFRWHFSSSYCCYCCDVSWSGRHSTFEFYFLLRFQFVCRDQKEFPNEWKRR